MYRYEDFWQHITFLWAPILLIRDLELHRLRRRVVLSFSQFALYVKL